MPFSALHVALINHPAEALAIFGTTDPGEVNHTFLDALREAGIIAVGCSQFEISVGAVGIFETDNGSKIASKALRADAYSHRELEALRTISTHLSSQGVPCARPLHVPIQLRNTTVLIDEFLYNSGPSQSRRGTAITSMAHLLWRIVEGGSGLPATREIAHTVSLGPPDSLWGRPHSPVFDFPGTASAAAWIDKIATDAKATASDTLDKTNPGLVLGHVDFSFQNVRLGANDSPVALFDMDSLMMLPEPHLAGMTAVKFTWTHGSDDKFPSKAQARSFVTAYEAARGRRFSNQELQGVQAAALYALAYVARCEQAAPWANRETVSRDALKDFASGWLTRSALGNSHHEFFA